MNPSWALTRRRFLQRAALAVPALAALPPPSHAGGPAATAPAGPAGSPVAPLPPLQPAAPPRKVIVIGAGLAGLAAAYELVTLGHDVVVLEAQLRPGGRIHTLRSPFADGLYAEAGGIDFGNGYRNLLRYVKVFGLSTAIQPDPPAFVCLLRGKRAEFKSLFEAEFPFALTAAERKLGLRGMFEKYFAAAAELGDPTDPGFRIERFKHLDEVTLEEHLRRQGASSEAIALFSSVLGVGYGWSTGSALHRLASDFALYLVGGPSNQSIAGGNDLLPRAFAKALAERIYYGSPVVRIAQQPEGVSVVFRQAGDERTLTADRVICAVPTPALRKVEIVPELPAAKRRILAELEYTPVTRIFVQVRRRVWAEGPLRGRIGDCITDLPVGLVTEYPLDRAADAGPRAVLESMTRGPAAERVGAWEQRAQLAFAVENFERLYPGFRDVVEGSTTVNWASDPWTGGGYAWWKPGQLTAWMPELARPEGRLHFAGEHTSALGRTMEGALISGNRAAREVHEPAA
jgi:monoamine oxidase